MTMQFERDHFDNAATLPMLVIVDPRSKHIGAQSGISRAARAGIVAGCLAALSLARLRGLAVAILRGEGTGGASDGGAGGWIKGFEPMRSDILLERRGKSCYSSEYFDEIAQAAGGDIVLAGFAGEGGCLATAADAISAGHRVTFLRDATYDRTSESFSESQLRLLGSFTKFDIRAATVSSWVSSLNVSLALGGARG